MASDVPSGKVLPFERPRRFPADLELLQAKLADEDSGFDEAELDDALACADAAITKNLPGSHEVKARLLDMRAHRTHASDGVEAGLAAWAAIIATYPNYLPAYVTRSNLLEEQGDHAAAIAEIDRFVELAPTEPQGYLQRATLYQAQGDDWRALANLRRVVQLDPTCSGAYLTIAQLLGANGDHAGAKRAYEKVAAEPLGDAESYGSRGFMLFLSGEEELALADYEQMVALAPNSPEALSWRGLLRLRQKDVEGAIADYTRFIALKPEDARGYSRRGEALVLQGKHAQAMPDLDRAIALGKDETGAAHFARSTALAALGDLEGSYTALDTAIERNPTQASYRLRRFQRYAEAEDWVRCGIDAEAMLARMPDDVSVLHAHARLCRHNDRRDDARAAYDRLISLDPKNAQAYLERSELLVGLGDNMAANADVDRAFELSPDDPEVRRSYGFKQLLSIWEEPERSALIEMVVGTAEPDDHEALAGIAYHLCRVSCHAEGMVHITRAIGLEPNKADYYMARIQCRSGMAPPRWVDLAGFQAAAVESLVDVEHAIALTGDDEDVEPYRARAHLREQLGDLQGAIEDQTKMMEIAPWFLDAVSDRARLRELTGDLVGAKEDAARAAVMEAEMRAKMATWENPIAAQMGSTAAPS